MNAGPFPRTRTDRLERRGRGSAPKVLYALHGAGFLFFLPLGLVMAPLPWTVALGGAALIAAAGGRVARRSPAAASALVFVSAAWWTVAQILLPVAP